MRSSGGGCVDRMSAPWEEEMVRSWSLLMLTHDGVKMLTCRAVRPAQAQVRTTRGRDNIG